MTERADPEVAGTGAVPRPRAAVDDLLGVTILPPVHDHDGAWAAAEDGPAPDLVVPRQRGWAAPPPAAPPRRHWIARILVAVLLAVGVGVAGAGAYAARSFAADEQANQPDRSTFVGALDQAARDRAVAAILDRRARAVREHRKDLFLADVDRTNTALLAAQGSLYEHLTVIPFGELKFVVHPDLAYDLAEPPLKNRFRLRLYSPAVTMSYKIEGVDDKPVAVPWVPVFGLEKGRWILTDDDTRSVASTRDFAGQAWDAAGPIEVHRGPRITVVVSAEDHARADRLVQMSEAALDEVLKVRPDKWPGRVFITAVRDPKVLGAYFSANGGKGDDNVAAIATAVYDEVLTWRGGGKKPGYASERVIFNPRSLDDKENQLSEILRHEFTHVAMGPVESEGVPRWLVEGYAEWVGMIDLRTGAWSSRLFDGGRKIPADLPTDRDFYADNGQNYVYSWSACRYIADRWGSGQLITLYEKYGKGGVADREAALLAVLGVTQAEFVAGWRQYVRQMVA